jgi:threonylcarbamoyladenosine tRNA methylthiotransferase MtaB
MILTRKKRRHARRDTIAFCEAVRRLRPEAAFGADIIAGFPTETDAMFENSMKLVDDAGLSFLHVFPFSARAGTPAARMPKVPGATVKDRAARLRAKGKAALDARLESLVGSSQAVLIEKDGAGHTPCFAPVSVAGTDGKAGAIVTARVTGVGETGLLAEIRA